MSTQATEIEVNVARAWLAQSRDYRSVPVGTRQTASLARGCRELVNRGEAAERMKIPGRYMVYRLHTAARAAFAAEQAAHEAHVASRMNA